MVNYNDFTERDDTNVITVVSSTSLSYDSCEADAGHSYILFKDYGDGYFSDCTLTVDGQVTDIWVVTTQKRSSILIAGLAYSDGQPTRTSGVTAPEHLAFGYGGFALDFYNPNNDAADLDVVLRSMHLSNTDTWAAAVVGTRYYFTIDKTGSDCTCYIYDDAPRTNLVDTLAITISDLPMSHLLAGGALVSGQDPLSKMSGNVKNLTIASVTSETLPDVDTTYCVDYTSFTEVDASGEDEIVSSTLIQTTQNERHVEDYIYRNYGVGYFDAVKHQMASQVTSVWYAVGFPGGVCIWGLSNNAVELNSAGMNNEGMSLFWQNTDATTLKITLRDYSGGDDSDDYDSAVAGWFYYFTIERSSGSNVMTCKIYKEADRSTLLDTLSISCGTDAMRYVYAESGLYSSDVNKQKLSGEFRYLELLELVAPDEPGTGGPTDLATNGEWPTSDLYVTIPDNQSDVTVYFYTSTGTLLGTVEGEGGETVSVPWDGLECEEEYSWYVVMDNGESVVTSVIWTFTCGSCNVFTIASESHPTIHLSPPRFRDGEQWQISKDIKRFGFWSETWAIHDNGIAKEPLSLVGWEWIDDNGDLDIFHAKFTDIHDIMNKHEEVAISGLGDCLDGYYIIKSFRFKTVKGAPRIREWRLELEFKREKTW